MPRNVMDVRLSQPINLSWQNVIRTVLKVLTFLPFLFLAPAVFTGNSANLSAGIADVAGTGGEILLILTLLVTPVITLTGWRWIAPMRRWYGIMVAMVAITDGIIAAITTTNFAGGPLGRVTGHPFLVVGLVMVLILTALLFTANNWAQRSMGKYWKWFQRLTYAVWALLWIHLAILEGFGYQNGANGSGLCSPGGEQCDGMPVFHQRLYQFTAVSIFLLVLRIPAVRKYVVRKREAGQGWVAWMVLSPLMILFLVGYLFIEHEFFFKGINLFKGTPSVE